MFARMHRFLIDEIVDLATQRLRRAFAILPDRCHEEFLADREGGRQRVEKGGATGVAAVPPARRGLLATELHVALLDPEIGRRGRVEGHEQLLRIINININVYNANIRHSQEMLLSCFRTAFSEADRKAVSLAYIGLRPCGPQVEERAMARMYKMARPAPKRRKRSGAEVREEGLAAARRLLLDGGPGAVTLANVGEAIGMSHANVLHHFGSAAGLQSALMGSMIQDLTGALDNVCLLYTSRCV